jgi:riboflavin kinase/FMN adenylyltransferase
MMAVIRGIENLKERYRNVALTIGNFDGVHVGHQKIFREVVARAKSLGGVSMAITFDPHPMKVVAPERGVRVLTPFDEKARLIEKFGIDEVLCISFSREFSNTKPDDFISDVIAGKIGAKAVIVGHKYTFGKGKKGTTSLLRRRGRRFGFSLTVIRNARLFGEVVSSSRIRSLVSRGRVCEVSWLLGRPYMIEGKVIKGAGRGRSLLNVPTANIRTPNEIVPREGVYAVKAGIRGKLLEGVANVGKNPTFGEGRMSYEVHLFDFSESVLGEMIRIYFIDRIRDEKTFPDIGSLHDGILRDIERAKDVLKTKKYPKVI